MHDKCIPNLIIKASCYRIYKRARRNNIKKKKDVTFYILRTDLFLELRIAEIFQK